MKTQKLLLTLIAWCVAWTVSAQDNQFSQYYANPTFINPAFTGAGQKTRFTFNYRNQWPELNKAFVTYAAAFDVKASPRYGAIGMSVLRDVIGSGEIASNQVNLMYAFPVKINHYWTASLGVQASYMQNSLNWNKLVFPDMIDQITGPTLATNQDLPDAGLTSKIFDFSAGAVAYSDNLFAGLSIHHIGTPANNLYDSDNSHLERKYSLQVGGVFHNRTSSLSREPIYYYPNLIVQKQGSLRQVNYGVYAKKNVFVGGLWYRQNFNMKADALIFLAGFYFQNLKLSYSYDLPVSSLLGYTYCSHELTVSMLFDSKPYRMKMKAMPCPDF